LITFLGLGKSSYGRAEAGQFGEVLIKVISLEILSWNNGLERQ